MHILLSSLRKSHRVIFFLADCCIVCGTIQSFESHNPVWHFVITKIIIIYPVFYHKCFLLAVFLLYLHLKYEYIFYFLNLLMLEALTWREKQYLYSVSVYQTSFALIYLKMSFHHHILSKNTNNHQNMGSLQRHLSIALLFWDQIYNLFRIRGCET